jgi:Rieske Fe-S protein
MCVHLTALLVEGVMRQRVPARIYDFYQGAKTMAVCSACTHLESLIPRTAVGAKLHSTCHFSVFAKTVKKISGSAPSTMERDLARVKFAERYVEITFTSLSFCAAKIK